MHEEVFIVRRYTQKQLAQLYGCTPTTLRRWLRHLAKDLGPRIGNFYTSRQVGLIVRKLGTP